ncbi:A-kinase anchor protein 1, mitochondrial-like [Anneissia japonica]|uniref:A-kinase anchor protein 1, mitochondrial-like n=1 Tax=Anneissia japonica TaxID=1529436 RepID=UPI001425772E|nr:A-kinase anchor protein 1, mitochondrial-like [Anneissia japonica]
MAQLRYTRAIACGAFVTAGLVGIYIYKKRGRSKKNLDNQKQSSLSETCSTEHESKSTVLNKDSNLLPPSDCIQDNSNQLNTKNTKDSSLSEVAQGLEDFEFDDVLLVTDVPLIEKTEVVDESCVETCIAPVNEVPALESVVNEVPIVESVISEEHTTLEQSVTNSDLEIKDRMSEEPTREINRESEKQGMLEWSSDVNADASEGGLELHSAVKFQSKDKDRCHVESDQGSEVNSEGSTDSGRGSTTILPPCSTILETENKPTIYQFEFPIRRIGKMIGKQGRSIKALQEKTGAKVVLEKIPYNRNYQNCVIKGLPSEVEAAIKEIQIRFPDVDVHRVVESPQPAAQQEPLVPSLQLFDEIVNDVYISNVVTACHVFVQQPLHPSFRALPHLQNCMSSCYSQIDATPPLPQPVDVGIICVALINESWCRAQVIAVHTDTDEIDVKLLDYGGYTRLDQACLRQIRSDFMSLPFQAVECYLAHIAPMEGEEGFSDTASKFLDELAQSYSFLEAEIVAYSEDGLPMLELFFTEQGQRKMINKELVERGLVSWFEIK